MSKTTNAPAVQDNRAQIQRITTVIRAIHDKLESDAARVAIRKALDADPDRVISAAKAYLRGADEKALERILACDPTSFVTACVDAARARLLPDGREGYLVPRRGKVKWQASWRGLVMLARRANDVQSFHAEVVYEGEIKKGAFLLDLGTNRRLAHKPYYMVGLTKETRGQIALAYCTWKLDGCEPDFHVVDRERLDDARRASGDPRTDEPSDVWRKYERAMSRKTAIRDAIEGGRLELPDSVREAVERELAGDRDDDGPLATVTPIDVTTNAPTGDPAQGWNGGQTSAAAIRSRAPKKTTPAPVDTTARESDDSTGTTGHVEPGKPMAGRSPEREPGEDEGELFDDVDGGRSQAP